MTHPLMQHCDKSLSTELYRGLLDRLEHNVPVVWSRFGDGEFRAIFHYSGRNASKHQYFPDLGDQLRGILDSKPEYNVGLQRNAVRKFGDRIAREFPDVPWTSTETLHDMSQMTGLTKLFSVLRDKDVVVVGPKDLAVGLRDIFEFQHIEVPLIDCWLDYPNVQEQCLNAVRSGRVMLFMCAMMANVLIDDLSDAGDMTLLDIGAAFDPYAGRCTRQYHKKMIVRMPEWV